MMRNTLCPSSSWSSANQADGSRASRQGAERADVALVTPRLAALDSRQLGQREVGRAQRTPDRVVEGMGVDRGGGAHEQPQWSASNS